MKMIHLLFLVFGIGFLIGCGEDRGSNERVIERVKVQLSETTAVTDHYPGRNQTDVPVDAKIQIDFSAPVMASTIDSFTFQIVNEVGQQVPGRYDWNRERTRIIFEPEYWNQSISLSRSTQYTVTTQFLKDRNGRFIGSNTFQFRTEDFKPTDGDFRIVNIEPDGPFIFAGSTIVIEFNRALRPPSDGEKCSTSLWNESIQVLNIGLNNGDDGNAASEQIAGRICLERSEDWPDKKGYNALEFQPLRLNDDGSTTAGFVPESVLGIRIIATDDLVDIDQNTLADERGKVVAEESGLIVLPKLELP